VTKDYEFMIEIKCIAYKRGFMDSEVEAKSYRIEKISQSARNQMIGNID
jgi:hypothetical protein